MAMKGTLLMSVEVERYFQVRVIVVVVVRVILPVRWIHPVIGQVIAVDVIAATVLILIITQIQYHQSLLH